MPMRSMLKTTLLFVGVVVLRASNATADLPIQLQEKSIVIGWTEFRTERSTEKGARERNVSLPYKLIVFVNKEGHVFSQLQVSNNSAYSNQSDLDTTDEKNFAHREVLFDAMAMSVTNSFGGGAGARRITASFDETLSMCTAMAITGLVDHGPAKQTTPNGGAVWLIAVKSGPATCSIANSDMRH
jgi:hypothetical protein